MSQQLWPTTARAPLHHHHQIEQQQQQSQPEISLTRPYCLQQLNYYDVESIWQWINITSTRPSTRKITPFSKVTCFPTSFRCLGFCFGCFGETFWAEFCPELSWADSPEMMEWNYDNCTEAAFPLNFDFVQSRWIVFCFLSLCVCLSFVIHLSFSPLSPFVRMWRKRGLSLSGLTSCFVWAFACDHSVCWASHLFSCSLLYWHCTTSVPALLCTTHSSDILLNCLSCPISFSFLPLRHLKIDLKIDFLSFLFSLLISLTFHSTCVALSVWHSLSMASLSGDFELDGEQMEKRWHTVCWRKVE